MALIDEESKSYIIGNKTPNLISALKSSFSSNDIFKKIDLTSTLTFQILMKLMKQIKVMLKSLKPLKRELKKIKDF